MKPPVVDERRERVVRLLSKTWAALLGEQARAVGLDGVPPAILAALRENLRAAADEIITEAQLAAFAASSDDEVRARVRAIVEPALRAIWEKGGAS